MAEGHLLFKKDEKEDSEKIRYAITLILYENGDMEFSPETSIDDESYEFDLNESYRVICDAKNRIENIRLSATLGFFGGLNNDFSDNKSDFN